MRPYSSSASEWLASEKNVYVTRPVTPMPTERTAAPRPKLRGPDKDHRPGERRPDRRDLTVAVGEVEEGRPGPVVHVARRVAPLAHVRAAQHVQHSPEWLARNRDQHVPARNADHLGERVLGVRDVLEDLDRGH